MSADIAVDAVRCTGHGLCALLLPEHVDLDRWGFPIVARPEVADRGGLRRAHRARRACPRAALLVVDRAPPE